MAACLEERSQSSSCRSIDQFPRLSLPTCLQFLFEAGHGRRVSSRGRFAIFLQHLCCNVCYYLYIYLHWDMLSNNLDAWSHVFCPLITYSSFVVPGEGMAAMDGQNSSGAGTSGATTSHAYATTSSEGIDGACQDTDTGAESQVWTVLLSCNSVWFHAVHSSCTVIHQYSTRTKTSVLMSDMDRFWMQVGRCLRLRSNVCPCDEQA